MSCEVTAVQELNGKMGLHSGQQIQQYFIAAVTLQHHCVYRTLFGVQCFILSVGVHSYTLQCQSSLDVVLYIKHVCTGTREC